MKQKTIWIILSLIIILAAVIRLWQLGSVPPSPNWDEVALGYNAYSILMTGKDEYGNFLPVVLRSYDDYKPGLYTYLVIPFISLFDLTAFTVRLPSAIFGVIAVIATFFLVRVLFVEYKYRDILALLASFLLSISPIAIQVSRIAFETNVGMVFNLLAALFFLVGLKRGWVLLFSASFAALSIYTYQSEKVFTPLFILVLLIIYWKDFWKVPKKYIIGTIAIGLIIVAPMALYLFSNPESLLRAQATSVLADQTTFLSSNIERLEASIDADDKLGILLNNRRFEYVKAFVAGYISHWDLNWIFITGDLQRHHAPEMGLLYYLELPFLLLGMYFLIFGNFARKTKLLIFVWFLLAPLPAAFTTGVPHALRTLNFLPTWQIFVALGLVIATIKVLGFKYQVSSIKFRYVIFLFFFIVFGFNFIYFINQHFSQQNYFYASDWQYGWGEAVSFVRENEGKYDRVIVSSKEPLDQPHMFFAFYLKYQPREYQESFASKQFGAFGVVKSFGKYEFVPEIKWDDIERKGKFLVVGTPQEITEERNILKIIKTPNGMPVVIIAETTGVN